MNISRAGIDLIKRFEGLRLEAYPDPGSGGEPYTIGFGSTRTPLGPVKPGMRITESEAEQLLLSDIRYFEQRVNDLVTVPLTQNQFDALVSLAYNCGDAALASSTLLRELNAGNVQEAADQFTRWVHASGQVLPGLVARRNAERNLFLSQSAGTPPPSAAPPKVAAPTAPIKDTLMAIPALVAAAGQALLPIVIDLFRSRGSKTSDRNANILEQASEALPTLVAIAKEVSPGANEQQTAEAILASKELQQQFRAAVALKWSDVEPFLRYDSEERDKARGFTERMTSGDDWRAVGYGLLVLTLILLVVGGGGYMLWSMVQDPATDGNTKGMIVGAVIAGVTMILQFFFGSSRGSQIKDQTALEQAKGK